MERNEARRDVSIGQRRAEVRLRDVPWCASSRAAPGSGLLEAVDSALLVVVLARALPLRGGNPDHGDAPYPSAFAAARAPSARSFKKFLSSASFVSDAAFANAFAAAANSARARRGARAVSTFDA